jgi:hypothetical protein
MSGQSGTTRNVATVLVVVADTNIASLCGELVAYAGHRPKHDFTNGVAGESVRRERPDIALIDAALQCPVIDACVDACDEVRARPVLTSSTSSETELIDQAQHRGCIPFPLPGRPQSLGHILDRLMQTKRKAPVAAFEWSSPRSIHPAFCAAIARMGRARLLAQHAREVISLHRLDKIELLESLDAVRHSRDALRAAVHDLAVSLREEHVPEARMLDIVETTMSECATIVGGESAIQPIGTEWREWALEAYRVA